MKKTFTKRKEISNNKIEVTNIPFDFSNITKNIKFNINQKKYIEFSFLLFNDYGVNKLTFDDVFKISIFKNAYDLSQKDSNGFMIYSGKEFSKQYQLLKVLGRVDAPKYKKWGLLESSSEEKYNGKGTYRFTELGKKFNKDVLGIK